MSAAARTTDQIRNAVRILTSDHNVRAVFVNIFGGILRCDILAEGLVAAVKELHVTLPIVIRMEGTNVEKGKQMLRESGLNFTTAAAVDEAAAAVVKLAGGSLMAVLLDKSTRLLVQGLTGREGTFHAKAAAAYGTTIVGGVTPGKGGTTHEGWPVFNTVHEAVAATGANASLIFVPPPAAADTIMEAVDAGVGAGRLHHRGHPDARHDARHDLHARQADAAHRAELPGPDLARARRRRASFRATSAWKGASASSRAAGRSPTRRSSRPRGSGYGQTTCIGIGGDPIIGTTFVDALRLFNADPETEAVVMIGEIGGSAEEEAADVHQARVQEAGRELHRRPDRPARDVGWGTRARSSPAARARRPRRWPRSRRPA